MTINESLVDKGSYQVFILFSKAHFPFNFFNHPWFVLNKKGTLVRYEIRHFKNKEDGFYLHRSYTNFFSGLNLFYFLNKKSGTNLLSLIEGSEALDMINFIEDSSKSYSYLNKYCVLGPNSNTYLKYILNNFPNINIYLNWKFVGKNYK
jgi:hypothetical protein